MTRRLSIESLEIRELLTTSSPSVVINQGLDLTNLRDVELAFTNIPDDAEQVRFAFNGFNYKPPVPFSPTMSVKIPSYQGRNFVNAEIELANGTKKFVYDSIVYLTPTAEINQDAAQTNLRHVTMGFKDVAPDAESVRFAFNNFNYQVPVEYAQELELQIPSYEGNNYVNAQIVYANGQTRSIWDSIEYHRATMEINAGLDLTHSRDVKFSFEGVASHAQRVSFAFNGDDFQSPVDFSTEMNVRLPNYDGVNYVNAKIEYDDGTELVIWDWIDHVAFRPTPGDRDGDGLLDTWETNGIDFNSDDIIDLVLPDADPDRKDLYIEVDAMVDRSPAPSSSQTDLPEELLTGTILDEVVEAFYVRGINLHLQMDETDVPRQPLPNAIQDLKWVRQQRWGTQNERDNDNADAILAAKQLSYRYALFADSYDTTTSSGFALPGRDAFAVTLGLWSTPGGTPMEQAGTFMHELGHNLGLLHGGFEEVYYKPNYHSVMNYLWQIPGQFSEDAHWMLDYSSREIEALDESALDESHGLGFFDDSGHEEHVLTLCGKSHNGSCESYGKTVPEVGSVDWNDDGDAVDSGIGFDLNADGKLTVLRGHNDWRNLLFVFSGTGVASGAHEGHADELASHEVDPCFTAHVASEDEDAISLDVAAALASLDDSTELFSATDVSTIAHNVVSAAAQRVKNGRLSSRLARVMISQSQSYATEPRAQSRLDVDLAVASLGLDASEALAIDVSLDEHFTAAL